MPKRKCVLTEKLRTEYPFIVPCNCDGKVNEKVKCTQCNAIFSIQHGGRSDITQHIATKRHKLAENASVSSKVSDYFSKKAMGEMERNLAADDATFAYHVCMHNQSFRSMDCTSKIIRKLYDKKFTCGQKKTQAIIVSVLAPYAMAVFRNELEKANYVSIMIDSSNHGALKIVPVLVRYFIPEEGIKTMVLEFLNVPCETTDQLTEYVWQLVTKWNIEKKVVALSADNTNTNFGGSSRRGKNNVFHKLKSKLNRTLIGVGCTSHIINNAIQCAADTLPMDVQAVIGKLYQHFYIYTVRVHTLKGFCDFLNTEYKTVLGHSKTRWLSPYPALKRMNEMYEVLKSYVLSVDKPPLLLKNFFSNPVSELIATFLECQSEMFHATICAIEGEKVTLAEAKSITESLLEKLQQRRDNDFATRKEQSLLKALIEDGLITEKNYGNYKNEFYNTCIEYIEEWSSDTLTFESLSWILLKNPEASLSWKSVQKSVTTIEEVCPNTKINETELFDEVMILKKAITEKEEIKAKSTGEIWYELFNSLGVN